MAERKNRTLEEFIRSLLSESKLQKRFWAKALATSTYIINRSPTKAVVGMTPYETFTGEKPDVKHLQVFGCICYAHIPKDERKKLDSKAREAIMLGYGTEVKGYRLYYPNLQKILFSRDVIFDESRMYTKENEKDKKLINIEDENHNKTQTTEEDSNSDLNTYLPDDERKSFRNKKAPEYYGEWTNAVNKSTPEPITVRKMKNEKWIDTMKDEINSLKRNSVRDLIQLPEGRKAIGCKWLYKIKYDADGNVERYKARLVAQGFNQI